MPRKINYYSLDQAEKELKKRRLDKNLLSRIENNLGDNFIDIFRIGPISVMWRTIIVPNNSFVFFLLNSQYLNMEPIALEFLGDMFTSVNEDKKKLSKIKLEVNGTHQEFKIFDIKKHENKKMDEIVLKNGGNLVSFYKELIKYSGLVFKTYDMTDWAKKNGRAKDYYYSFLLHFIAHGVLFENFFIDSNDKYENKFTEECIIPTINRIKKEIGLDPIIIKIFPEAKNEDDELYWWSFPNYINEYIVKYMDKFDLN
jgi:hypothetical protein